MRKLTRELDDINIVVVRGGSRRNTVKTVRIDADVDCDRAFIRRQIRKARKARRDCLKELDDSDRSNKGSEDDKKKKKKKLITTSSPDDRRYLKKGKSTEEEEEASPKSRKGEQVIPCSFHIRVLSHACIVLLSHYLNKQVLNPKERKVKVLSRAARVMARIARARVVVRAGVPLDLKTQSQQDLDLSLNQDLDLSLDQETKTQIALTLPPQKDTTTRE